jgi:hypothetical protein
MRSNQLRLYFSSIAYLLMQALRRLGLQGTELAQAQATTIRLKVCPGESAPNRLAKSFVFRRRRVRKQGLDLDRLSTGAFSTPRRSK